MEEEKQTLQELTEQINKEEVDRKIKEQEDARIKAINEAKEKEVEKNNNKGQNKYIIMLIIIILLALAIVAVLYFHFNKEEPAPDVNAPLEERITYVLNKRYGKEFKFVEEGVYEDDNGTKFAVTTNDRTESKLIVYDEYLDILQINKITSKISTILTTNGLNNVAVTLSGSRDCRFVGVCASDEYYYNTYKENTDESLLEQRSNDIDLAKYVSMSNNNFFNEYGLKINITIKGEYEKSDINTIKNIINTLFNELNDSGYENNLGYKIVVKAKDNIQDILVLEGDKTNDKTFDLLLAKESY